MKYIGVYKDNRYPTYRVDVWVNKKIIHIGSFLDVVEAAKEYDKAALFYLKDPNINFPELIKEYIKNPYVPNQARSKGTSKYLGVSYVKRGNKWQAKMRVGKKIIHIGYYKTEEDAAIARDKKARELLGPSIKLNFPNNA
jgi:hypothetical protein